MALKDIAEDLMKRSEKQLTQFAAELLQNKQFTEALVQALDIATQARNQVDKRLQNYYRQFNLPDRKELETIAGKVKDLAKSLSDLDNRISRLARQVEDSLKARPGAA